jgi:predicted secreted protein
MFTFNDFITLILIWVVILFICLPIGIKNELNPIAGQERGAPAQHNFGMKIIISLLISTVLTLLYGYIVNGQ